MLQIQTILCAKCFKTNADDGTEITKVVGKKANFGTSGIVDKVVVVKNKEGLRTSKIRIRKEKVPGIGDKFASRCGQKGMCGMVLEQWEMPFTKDLELSQILLLILTLYQQE